MKNLAASVALGAFGAHGLKNNPNISAKMVENWNTAAHYHLLLLMFPARRQRGQTGSAGCHYLSRFAGACDRNYLPTGKLLYNQHAG